MTIMMNLVAEKRENLAHILANGQLKIVHQEAKKHAVLKMTMKMKMTMRTMIMEIFQSMICGALTQMMLAKVTNELKPKITSKITPQAQALIQDHTLVQDQEVHVTALTATEADNPITAPNVPDPDRIRHAISATVLHLIVANFLITMKQNVVC